MGKEGCYVIRTYVAGDIGEKTKFFVPGKKPDCDLTRRQKNAIKKQAQNEYSALKAFRRKIHANFKAGDLLLGLDYNDDGLERVKAWGRKKGLPIDSENEMERNDALWEAASHELEIALRRVNRRLKKQGIELKVLYTTSDMDGDTGEIERVHHHLIVNAGVQEAFLDAWEKYGLGTVDWEPLWKNQIDRTRLAEYIMNQVRRIPDAKKYRCTKNLVTPVPKDRIVNTDNELQVPKGGKLIYRQEYENRMGSNTDLETFSNRRPQYIRYITPKALKRLDAERNAVRA